jgi:peptidoglycan L-alanyl-D-glutamate endopeptidase CwlK|tara:strand:+ start:1049 stop:1447 length:399 start_codon:yes stop_codon:yes gene_type:complete
MPSFGAKSKANLSECHPDLQKVFNKVIQSYDCSVIEGYRGKEEQDAAFHSGKSKLQYPKSKHNRQPALAADVIPYPVDWDDTKQFYHFAGFVQGIAEEMGIQIRWGGDWNSNRLFEDQSFHDLPHYELIKAD